MSRWNADFHRGIRCLAGHDPAGAIGFLSKAVQSCPLRRPNELTRSLYYLGVALKRLGYDNSAIRSWVASHRMRKGGHSRAVLQRFCNEYGMAKQDCEAMDDWQAFYSIQLRRYLSGFKKRSLSDPAERSMIYDVIHDAWMQLKRSGVLARRSAQEKYEIFLKTKIDFPLFYFGGLHNPVLPVNFTEGRQMKPGDPCPCGSGLRYGCCCARTPGEDELSFGLF